MVPLIDLVIFDNDGVVVDSELLANRVLSGLLTECGLPTSVEECIRDYMGGTLARVRAQVAAQSGLELPIDFDDEYHARLFASFAAELQPVPGIRAVLDGLDALARPYCLASSGTRERILRSLTIAGLLPYFEDRIFSAEQVARGKPDPDLFLYAASVMGIPPSRCVVVEDSPSGVAAARAAGMNVVGYAGLTPPGKLGGAHHIVATMSELLPVLTRL